MLYSKYQPTNNNNDKKAEKEKHSIIQINQYFQLAV